MTAPATTTNASSTRRDPNATRGFGPSLDRSVAPIGTVKLTLLHYRYGLLETLRIPIAVLSTALFPALSLLFFVIPQGDLASDPLASSAAAAQLSVFSIMSVCLFSFGAGVAEDRAKPWDPFLRTLPAGPGPRLTGRLLGGITFAFFGLIPLLLLATVLTEATIPIGRILPAVLAWVIAGIPFLGIGLAIGYLMSSKAAIAVANVLLLPLAFLGGLFLPPSLFPDWLDTVSTFVPTRAGRDLLVGTVTGSDIPVQAIVVLIAWSVAMMALAVFAFRRDEGQRFR